MNIVMNENLQETAIAINSNIVVRLPVSGQANPVRVRLIWVILRLGLPYHL